MSISDGGSLGNWKKKSKSSFWDKWACDTSWRWLVHIWTVAYSINLPTYIHAKIKKVKKILAPSALKIHFSGTYTQSLSNNVYGFLHLRSALKIEKLVYWKIFPNLYLEDSIFGADSFQKAKNKISLKLQLIIITFFFGNIELQHYVLSNNDRAVYAIMLTLKRCHNTAIYFIILMNDWSAASKKKISVE